MMDAQARIQSLLRTLLAGIIIYSPVTVYAHGGVSIEDDSCVMKVGDLKAHFTGYQPEVRSSQEFCEDIPEVRRAIIVLDYISNELRDMPAEFRVLRDVSGKQERTTYDDLGGPSGIEAATLFHKPPEVYPRGTLTAEYDFKESGWYVGVVTVENPHTGESIHSVFPFSVGLKDWWRYPLALLLILVFSTLAYNLSMRNIERG